MCRDGSQGSLTLAGCGHGTEYSKRERSFAIFRPAVHPVASGGRIIRQWPSSFTLFIEAHYSAECIYALRRQSNLKNAARLGIIAAHSAL
jgi:hypothetical protein